MGGHYARNIDVAQQRLTSGGRARVDVSED
jgi:hypothetical protein